MSWLSYKFYFLVFNLIHNVDLFTVHRGVAHSSIHFAGFFSALTKNELFFRFDVSFKTVRFRLMLV